MINFGVPELFTSWSRVPLYDFECLVLIAVFCISSLKGSYILFRPHTDHDVTVHVVVKWLAPFLMRLLYILCFFVLIYPFVFCVLFLCRPE